MYPKPIQTLIDFFLKFPGVGPKQAARFVFYMLRAERGEAEAIADAIARLRDEIEICSQCYKTFGTEHALADQTHCELCRDQRRERNQILIVEKEVDLLNIERTHRYQGLYHVLGGTIDPLDAGSPGRLHLKELFNRAKQILETKGALEVILATNPTAEGDATALYLERVLAPLKNQSPNFKISRLGRGLTTGSELEYADDVTIQNALENRK